MRYNSWYISLPSFAKQQREMTKFCVVWKTRTTTANFSYFCLDNDVIPPHKLYHPVLLHCQGGKLTFPLCAKCVAEEMQKPMLERSCVCRHNDEERMLRGTWCTPELLKAREKGYRIVRIHKVWHFRHRIKGLFKDYANQWLKVKQESSGYPAWVDTDTITRRIKASISTQTRSPKMPYRFGTDTHDRVTTTACTGTTTQ